MIRTRTTIFVGQISSLLRYHYSTIPKRHVRDSNPRTCYSQQFSRLLPRPTGHMPRKTPSRRVFHNRNQSGYLIDGDGVEPPEPEGNSFTDCPATTYGISIETKVVMFFDTQNSQTFPLLYKLDLGISSKDCTGFHVLQFRRTVPLFTDLIGHDPITSRLTDECSAS